MMAKKGGDKSIGEKLHPLTKKLLERRGIEDREVEDFLFPSYEKHVGDPFDMYGMKEAVDRVIQAIKNEEKIAIYSDYDCDGIPGGVLLRSFFDDIGYPVEIYIPHRHNEGYGVHNHALDALKERGVTLVITVDSGITNVDEVVYAKSIGIDMIVTDHHLPLTKDADVADETQTSQTNTKSKGQRAKGKKLNQVVPDAVAVINSKQDVCTYHDDMLCGCAVAWKLSCAILTSLRDEAKIAHKSFHNDKRGSFETVLETVSKLPLGWEKWMLDLVAISTIADMVPLRKENRALAHFGLKVLRKTRRPGLLHIFNEQRLRQDYINEDDIAFTLAPRINAASRMGDPMQAHLALYERHPMKAEQYARDLEMLNNERKAGVKDVLSTISFDHDVYKNDVIVVGDMSWGPGILGLIAQKIIDETGKPVFVWGAGTDSRQQTVDNREISAREGGQNAKDESEKSRSKMGGRSEAISVGEVEGRSETKILNEVKGSCRSLGDVSVVDLMAHVGKVEDGGLFERFGGHEGAGGFAISVEHIEKVSDALNDALQYVEKKEIAKENVEADEVLSMDDVHEVTHNAIQALAPFGEGNHKPVFAFNHLTPASSRIFGNGNRHLEVVYRKSDGSFVKAIKFFVDDDTVTKAKGEHSLLAHIEKSYFGGKAELRLRIVEIR